MLARQFLIPSLLSMGVAAALGVWRLEIVADLDLRAHDMLARQTPPPPFSPRIAVVDIDERSLADLGQWPWPRSIMAALVTALDEAGASVIALDILFAEPDRYDRAASDTGGTASGASTPSTDGTLASAVAHAKVVGGLALTFDPRSQIARLDAHCLQHDVEPAQRSRADDEPLAALFEGTGAVCDVPPIARAAKATGAINASPDADGVLRRLPLLTRVADRTFPSLALAAVQLVDPQTLVLERAGDGTLALRRGARRLGLDRRGNTLLRLRGPQRTYPYISAADVVARRVPAAILQGRIVFVGATALGVHDVWSTALDAGFPGVELHATLADTLLGGPASARPEFADVYELGSAIVASLVAAVALVGLGGPGGVLAIAGSGAGIWTVAGALYSAGTVLSPVSALVGLAAGITTTAAYRLAVARRRIIAEQTRRAQAQRLVVHSLTSLVETRGSETGQHARRTRACTEVLLSALAARRPGWRRLTPAYIELLSALAPLHDIGKVGISDAVLNKPGALTADEVAEMRTHPSLGHASLLQAERLSGVQDDEVLAIAKEVVYTHHERWDGTGYPRGLRGTEIPLAGRVVALADVYDALVSTRAYRAALSHAEAVEIIKRGRGTHFDPDIVDAFLACQDSMRRAVAGANGRASRDVPA
jgi:adenylate cyclase